MTVCGDNIKNKMKQIENWYIWGSHNRHHTWAKSVLGVGSERISCPYEYKNNFIS